jgi:hypothetical protein
MVKWKADKHSWNEIMDRLEELEAIELPYMNTLVLKDRAYDEDSDTETITWTTHEDGEHVKFAYEISNYYPTVKLWLSTGGHAMYHHSYIALAEVDKNFEGKREGRQVFKTKKAAMCFCLNKWENYIKNKKYEKDKAKFDKWVEGLVGKKVK